MQSGMLEVAKGNGCDLLTKGHIFNKRTQTKNNQLIDKQINADTRNLRV
jgi:hypothetical protein